VLIDRSAVPIPNPCIATRATIITKFEIVGIEASVIATNIKPAMRKDRGFFILSESSQVRVG